MMGHLGKLLPKDGTSWQQSTYKLMLFLPKDVTFWQVATQK